MDILFGYLYIGLIVNLGYILSHNHYQEVEKVRSKDPMLTENFSDTFIWSAMIIINLILLPFTVWIWPKVMVMLYAEHKNKKAE